MTEETQVVASEELENAQQTATEETQEVEKDEATKQAELHDAVVGMLREQMDIPEMSDEDREAFIDDWNKNNKADGEIRKEKPTAEELAEVANAYNDEVQKYNGTLFELADTANALRVAKFLKKWNEEDAHWEGNMYVGVKMFDDIIRKFIKSCAEKPEPLMVNYGTLTYLFLAMRSVSGVGLRSAIHMIKINDEFTPILDRIGDLYSEHQEYAKKIQLMQERWRMFELGFYVTYWDLEEKKELVAEVNENETIVAGDAALECAIETCENTCACEPGECHCKCESECTCECPGE